MVVPTSETNSTNTSPPPISITATSPIPIQNVHYHISEKLTQDNYSLWQYLMVPFLEGQNLFGHVDDTIYPGIIKIELSLAPSSPPYPWRHYLMLASPQLVKSELPWKLSLLLNLNLVFSNSSSSSPT
jgi:hypothetical protein